MMSTDRSVGHIVPVSVLLIIRQFRSHFQVFSLIGFVSFPFSQMDGLFTVDAYVQRSKAIPITIDFCSMTTA